MKRIKFLTVNQLSKTFTAGSLFVSDWPVLCGIPSTLTAHRLMVDTNFRQCDGHATVGICSLVPVVSTVCTRHQAEKPLGRIIRFCINKDEAELITSEPCLTIVSQDQSARMNEHFHIQNPAADQLPIV
ncbi:hypothetical protein Tsp_08230 [Trichinella spiralis]|uniref:hypothetical protein n=1 Tax=Trichinella spiralis TaxID=6334 RepID=UPI0001EFEA5E|nr:hypothetical protein Tsp_08230 [Trichinella spiralis]